MDIHQQYHEVRNHPGSLAMVELPDGEEHHEELALHEYIAFRDKQGKLESQRWAGYSQTGHPAVQVLDILQESTTILRKHNGALLAMALALAVPLSMLLLSHVLLLLPLMKNLVTKVQLAATRRYPPQTGHRRLAEIIVSNVVDIPFSALFSPLLKAGVAYVVATTYGRKKLKLADVVDNLHKTRSLLLQTFLWTFSVYFAVAIAFAAVLWLAWRIGGVPGLLVAAPAGVALAAGVAFANVACSLAYVVAVLEGAQGREAVVQSGRLLMGRAEAALLLFLVTNVNSALLDILFEFHIIRGDAAVVYDKYWEAPLLVCMHSFVHLFDAIMVSVLYFICKSAEPDCRPLHPAVEHNVSSSFPDSVDVSAPPACRSPFAVR